MFSSGALPLFLKVEEPSVWEASLELVAFGVSGSGFTGGIPLYLHCGSGSNVASGLFPLFLAGSPLASSTASIPLFLDGCTYSSASSLELFLANSGVDGSLPLFIQGSGISDGYHPLNGSMNLFVQRNTANAIPLFLAGPGNPSGSGIPLYSYGVHTAGSGLDLALPSIIGVAGNHVKLFVGGW